MELADTFSALSRFRTVAKSLRSAAEFGLNA
jgi:hypothetical protein